MAGQSSFVPVKALDSGAVWLPRIGFFILFAFSWFGNYVQFVGGWNRVGATDEGAIYAVLGSLAYQIVIGYWQWCMIYKYGFWNIWYQIPLWLSAFPSILTYTSVFVPRIASLLPTMLPLPVRSSIGWIGNIAFCAICDRMTETIATGGKAKKTGGDAKR